MPMHQLSALSSPRCQSRPCVVCAAPLRHGAATQSEPYPTCHAVACRMVVSRRGEMGEAAFRHYLQHQVQEKQRQAARTREYGALLDVEATENAHVWQALYAYARLPADLSAAPLRLLLPSGPRRSRPLSAKRRQRYRAHLMDAALKAEKMAPFATEAPAEELSPAPPSASSLPGRLCALCGGGCCTRGVDHAYLKPATLRAFMDAQPQLSVEQVVDAYMARLGSATQAGSCINHTSGGCSLPREMRSDICNRYMCASLGKLEAQGHAVAVHPVLVVRRKQDQWHRDNPGPGNALIGAALLREMGVRHMPIPAKHCI